MPYQCNDRQTNLLLFLLRVDRCVCRLNWMHPKMKENSLSIVSSFVFFTFENGNEAARLAMYRVHAADCNPTRDELLDEIRIFFVFFFGRQFYCRIQI